MVANDRVAFDVPDIPRNRGKSESGLILLWKISPPSKSTMVCDTGATYRCILGSSQIDVVENGCFECI